MSPIKVVHLLDVEKEAHFFGNLADFSDSNDVEFCFVTFAPEGSFTSSIRRRNLKVYSLNVRRKLEIPKAVVKIWRILRAENPNIVHVHQFIPSIVGLFVARCQRRKAILTRHHSDAVHLIPSNIKRHIYLAVERLINREAIHIIAPSRMVRDCVVEWEKTPPEKVSVIPYGQDSARFDEIMPNRVMRIREELGMNEQISLVCVSRLFHSKGHKYLFEAIAPLIHDGLKVKLFLVGTGKYEDKLQEMASVLRIRENIEFLGWRDDALEIIAAADIIVHPSLEDALSQSLIESLMLARPIVATDISGAADTLCDGRFGCLVPPADADRFRLALKSVIENLEAARKNAESGRDYLLDYMSASRVANSHLAIYRNTSKL